MLLPKFSFEILSITDVLVRRSLTKYQSIKVLTQKLDAKIPSGEYLKEKHLLICDISMYTFFGQNKCKIYKKSK